MKKFKEIYIRLREFKRVVLDSKNYIVIGINESDKPGYVDIKYYYKADLSVLSNCFVEIIETEKGQQEALKKAKILIGEIKE